MKLYHNLPNEQWGVQFLVDNFNADEALWHSLKRTRRLRRKSVVQFKRRQHHMLDVLELLRFPDDCLSTFRYEGDVTIS